MSSSGPLVGRLLCRSLCRISPGFGVRLLQLTTAAPCRHIHAGAAVATAATTAATTGDDNNATAAVFRRVAKSRVSASAQSLADCDPVAPHVLRECLELALVSMRCSFLRMVVLFAAPQLARVCCAFAWLWLWL